MDCCVFCCPYLIVNSQATLLSIVYNEMPTLEQKGQYPLIDIDPHFSRVVRFFRVSDYAAWAALSAGTPALYYAWGGL